MKFDLTSLEQRNFFEKEKRDLTLRKNCDKIDWDNSNTEIGGSINGRRKETEGFGKLS